MLTNILPDIQASDQRIVSKWNELLNVIKTRMKVEYLRFKNIQGFESDLIRLLRFILSNVDVEYIFNNNGDMDTYIDYLDPKIDNLISSFDTMRQGTKNNFFVTTRSTEKCEEILLPGIIASPLMNLPFGKDWNQWKEISPVKIIYTNSNELNYSIGNNKLTYKYDTPEVCIINIDPIKLVYKFIAYCKENDTILSVDDRMFLHNEVILPLMNDLVDTWILNTLIELVDYDSTEELNLFNIIRSTNNEQISGVNRAYKSIYEELDRYKQRKCKLGTICNIKYFTDDRSLLDIIEELQLNCILPMQRQYDPFRFVRDFGILEFIIKLLPYQDGNNDIHNITVKLRRIIKQYDNNNVINRLPATIRTFYNDKFEIIKSLIDELK